MLLLKINNLERATFRHVVCKMCAIIVCCSIDCLYTPTDYLQHNFKAQVISPGEIITVTFDFYPRAAMRYTEFVEFEVNGLSRNGVEFTGLGTEMKVRALRT